MKTTTFNLLSLPQVAERVGVSRQAIHLAVQEGRLKAKKTTIGGRTVFLVTPSEADKFAKTRKAATA